MQNNMTILSMSSELSTPVFSADDVVEARFFHGVRLPHMISSKLLRHAFSRVTLTEVGRTL